MLEPCGGVGGISRLAFSRGLSSGGNLDNRAFVDLGNREVDVLQPNCRTSGLPSYFNAKVNYDTWHEHHKEDLPHIKLCEKVAVRQNELRRFYLREQTVGTWADQIPPWT
eukprot:6549454-Pyramimonas_sp.AAC.1